MIVNNIMLHKSMKIKFTEVYIMSTTWRNKFENPFWPGVFDCRHNIVTLIRNTNNEGCDFFI